MIYGKLSPKIILCKNYPFCILTCYLIYLKFFRKQIILSEKKFDFLKDLVANIPDVQANEEEETTSDHPPPPKPRTKPPPVPGQAPRPRGRWGRFVW